MPFPGLGWPNSPKALLSPLSPQFSPDSLHISENSKEHEVTVHSTVPIPCYGPDHGHQCGVPLALSVHDPGQTCRKTGDSVLLICNEAHSLSILQVNHLVKLFADRKS